jgi:triosephosphate isomerase
VPQLIAGNWKMNGLKAHTTTLCQALRAGAGGLPCELLVCPPFTRLAAVADALAGSGIAVGGQDCHQDPEGPHTGDISAAMLADAGASWVILGHSERRLEHAEVNDLIRQKVEAAQAAGLRAIVCVGETEDQRGGGEETNIVGWQLLGSLPRNFTGVVAYEPVWAIGSGRIPTVEQVAQMHGFIRAELGRQFSDAGAKIPILYGGSVKPDNAAELLAVPEVGGALVGGSSLWPAEFLAIAAAARAD